MTEPRTAAYLRDLRIKLNRQMNNAVNTAGELCDCPDCTAERTRKQSDMLAPCQQMKIVDSVLDHTPSNVHPELSSNPNLWD